MVGEERKREWERGIERRGKRDRERGGGRETERDSQSKVNLVQNSYKVY